MQRRRSERIPLNLAADIFLGGKAYDGTIVNVSADGTGSAVTLVIDTTAEFIPANTIHLHFQEPSGQAIDLNCELEWFSRSESDAHKIAIGMSIVNPSQMYEMFVKKLYDASLMERSKEQLIAELLAARRRIAELEAKSRN